MDMRWAPAPARPRAPRRPADQPSFSSTLLDAICDSMDGPEARSATAAARAPAAARKQQEAALHYYYYKPALAASHRARGEAPTQGAAAADFSGRGYFSSSEVECSLGRLNRIRTSGAAAPRQKQQQQQQQPAPEKTARTKKPAAATRPASPGARLASLLNSIFAGKRHSAQRTAPTDQEPACSTAPSYARSCLSKTPPPSGARASRSRSTRTVRFLDIDGELAVAAAAVGRCRRIPVVEVEEELLRPADVEAHIDGGEKSSDASSDLFELENLAATASESGRWDRDGSYGNELPVYGTTGAGLHRGIAHPRPYEYGPYGLGRSCRKVV
ncbi:Protein BIG GRAIN 1-like [Hordeum vulgare]|uniref:Protein BIG GRAIN 1-like n=1 Tax=Hordeum vulgare subsp. vulgare TaxID=112509 RepID=A0A8I6X2I9_HORVV|nr:protein BIG GRAIN 1-like [Hordeum vulgare subsp. vulgare]KAE8777655.1 Protein BIG GRAIN 1-like [Hordeum vulgare]